MSTSTRVNRSLSRDASAEYETLNLEHNDAVQAIRDGPPCADVDTAVRVSMREYVYD